MGGPWLETYFARTALSQKNIKFSVVTLFFSYSPTPGSHPPPTTDPPPRPSWAAANGGVTNGGFRGVWPPFPEIDRNRPFSPFFWLFRPFPEGTKSTWEIQKTEEKGLFLQIPSDFA